MRAFESPSASISFARLLPLILTAAVTAYMLTWLTGFSNPGMTLGAFVVGLGGLGLLWLLNAARLPWRTMGLTLLIVGVFLGGGIAMYAANNIENTLATAGVFSGEMISKVGPIQGSFYLPDLIDAPVVEELLKSAVAFGLALMLRRGRYTVYCALAVALGFTMFEDVIYVTANPDLFWQMWYHRLLTPIIHTTATGLVGLALNFAWVRRGWAWILPVVALPFAMCLHGLNNMFASLAAPTPLGVVYNAVLFVLLAGIITTARWLTTGGVVTRPALTPATPIIATEIPT